MTDTTVTPLHTPAQRATITATEHYDRVAEQGSTLLPLSRDEVVVIAHLRGWCHFGPLCRLCKAESTAATTSPIGTPDPAQDAMACEWCETAPHTHVVEFGVASAWDLCAKCIPAFVAEHLNGAWHRITLDTPRPQSVTE